MFMFPYDINAVNLVYGQPFISIFSPTLYKWHILEYLSPRDSVINSMILFLISIFFSVATALFCLSVSEEKRKKFKLPFALSLIAVLSNLIQFLVGHQPYSPSNVTISYYAFVIFSISILFLGLSFIEIAVNYEHIMPDAVKLG
jgi:hypothetical protein